MKRARYRIRFSKTGPLRWISHRDLIRLWERLLRRVDLNLSMSEGFHPKPRMSFPSALALGTQSIDEVVEFELTEDLPVGELAQRLRDDQQPGLEILKVTAIPDGSRKAQLKSTTYNLPIPDSHLETLRKRIEAFLRTGTIQVDRKGKMLSFSVSAEIPYIALEGSTLVFRMTPGRQASLRPTDLMDALNLNHVIEDGQMLTRTRVELDDELESQLCVTEQTDR
ncbi:MAG: TIGR03936 family radical SAM-associated protein [Pirellulaceae bacterium]